jgi:hypothetical protein
MPAATPPPICPDCDEPLMFAFRDTSGVGAWKLGDGFNTTPDTDHYLCLPCGRAWKQRLDGPFTQDIVGDLAFFSCSQSGCGQPLAVTAGSDSPTDGRLACPAGHRYAIVVGEGEGLALSPIP